MTNAMDNLYLRANTQTIDAADHNTVVQASQFLYANNLRGYPLGDGRDGAMCLGVITATTTTAPTMAIAGTGNLTGTYYYKVSAYNLSGETAASSASAAISPSAQAVNVTIPPTGNNTNITGFYIYRSTSSGGTYYRVGQLAVADATNGGVFYDNNPITSGTAPQGSNTSTTTATLEGFYQATSFTMASGQTITLSSNSPTGLYIVSQGAITIPSGATITGSGTHAQGPFILGGSGFYPLSPTVLSSSGDVGGQPSVSQPGMAILGTSNAVKSNLLRAYNGQGLGGGGTLAGGSVILISGTQVTIGGTITLSGAAGTATSPATGGGAGGTFAAIAPIIDRSGATITLTGGAGGNGSSTYAAGGGGGGGVAAFVSDNIVGSATVTLTAGAAGSAGSGTTVTGGGGGGNGGAGGSCFGGGGGGVASAGSVGISVDISLRTFDLRM